MINFTVQDMTCGHCVATITRAVHAVDPAARVSTDLASKRVAIDSGSAPERLKAAIEEAGYETIQVTKPV